MKSKKVKRYIFVLFFKVSRVYFTGRALKPVELQRVTTYKYGVFGPSWYGRPNPEERINRKPKDRIFDRKTE